MRELFDAWTQNADTTYIVIQEMPSELRTAIPVADGTARRGADESITRS